MYPSLAVCRMDVVDSAYGQRDDSDVVLTGQMRHCGEDKHEDHTVEIAVQRLESVDERLKCVWSGFPGHERSCRSRIPTSVVVRAWHREMQLKGSEEGFFHFSWRSGVWLGYGLSDGAVRGVYCPTHRAKRESRGPQKQIARAD